MRRLSSLRQQPEQDELLLLEEAEYEDSEIPTEYQPDRERRHLGAAVEIKKKKISSSDVSGLW